MSESIVDDYVMGHWELLHAQAWWHERWPNFAPRELATKDETDSPTMVRIYVPALDALQRIRTAFRYPMVVNSAFRDERHNARVGGGSRSQHLFGKAFDVHVLDAIEGRRLEAMALEEGAGGIGRYPRGKGSFIHMDWRPRKRDGGFAEWGTWNS